MHKRLLALAGYATLGFSLPTLAYAHPGHADGGLAGGFLHPVSGVDHLLAMVLIGIIAAQIGGRALYALPLSFIGMMTVGAAFGIVGFSLPYVELGIIFSLIVFGLLVALNTRMPTAVATVLAGGFALFHG